MAVCGVAWRVRMEKETRCKEIIETPIETCKIRMERLLELCKEQAEDCKATGDGFHIWV